MSRLVDSPPVREALQAAPDATLVLALTRQVFDDVVRQGHVSFSRADFTRVTVQVKEFQDEAWIRVFGKHRLLLRRYQYQTRNRPVRPLAQTARSRPVPPHPGSSRPSTTRMRAARSSASTTTAASASNP